MFVRAVVVGACMLVCIQGYWNGPTGLMHGGADMLAVGSIQDICLRKFVTHGNLTLSAKTNFIC